METEKYTYHQIDEQGDAATVLVPRSNGEITVGTMTGMHDVNGNALISVITEDGTMKPKAARREGLSDQVQQQLAAKLGGAALYSKTDLLFASDEIVQKVVDKQKARQDKNPPVEDTATLHARRLVEADNRYNIARRAGFSHEQAQASADRAWK